MLKKGNENYHPPGEPFSQTLLRCLDRLLTLTFAG